MANERMNVALTAVETWTTQLAEVVRTLRARPGMTEEEVEAANVRLEAVAVLLEEAGRDPGTPLPPTEGLRRR